MSMIAPPPEGGCGAGFDGADYDGGVLDADVLDADVLEGDLLVSADLDAELAAIAENAPDAVDLVCEVDDMMAAFAAERFRRIDAMRRSILASESRNGRVLTDVVERGVRLELAAALRMSESVAGDLMAMAESLVNDFPAVLDSLGQARMSERHARHLVTTMLTVESDLHEALVPRAIALAETESLGAFRRSLRRLVEAARYATLEERHAKALEGRRVVLETGDDAMATLLLVLPAVEAQAIFLRATAMAKVFAAVDGETRTLDQLRADIVCDLLIEGQIPDHPAEARGIRASVAVTVPALALLEAAEGTEAEGAEAEGAEAEGAEAEGAEAAGAGERGTAGEGDSRTSAPGAPDVDTVPATVEGIGPIPMSRAVELCGTAGDWMRVLTHPETGIVVSVGRVRYRPPESLRRLVRWRSERCMAPGCGVPASRCEIDHTVDWQFGGQTALANLAPFCKGHHRVKHHGGWEVTQVEGSGGVMSWTSPTGRRYLVEPERRFGGAVSTVAFQPSEAPPF
jgi:hypothetical protein